LAKRAAQELRDGYYVNLGIGIATLVAITFEGMERYAAVRERPLGIGPFRPKTKWTRPD